MSSNDKQISENRLAAWIVFGVLGAITLMFGTITLYNYFNFLVQIEVVKEVASYWPTALENSIKHIVDGFVQILGR